ncbi:MAG: MoaD/ThiS family protein [Syntrophaceae bacterium]|nr:MoaD/ThiS family protein [Syntrophaceae bacterium]
MNIQIELIGFPVIYDLFPAGPHPYSLSGNTLLHLVNDLIARHDSRMKEALLDSGAGALDPTIQIRINQTWIPREKIPEQKLEEGDRVTFMKLLAGG